MSINKKSRKRRQKERATASAENIARCLEKQRAVDRYTDQQLDALPPPAKGRVMDPHAGEGFIRRSLRQLIGRPSGRT